MIKNNKKNPIKKIQLKNLSDAKNLLTKTAGAVFAIGAPRLKPVGNIITGVKNVIGGSISAYRAGRRVEQFKKSGQHSFTNLSQKQKKMQESSPMTEMEYHWPMKNKKVLQETAGRRKIVERDMERIGNKDVFRTGKTSVGGGRDTISDPNWVAPSNRVHQSINAMNIPERLRLQRMESNLIKGKKPRNKG
tara:strand:+ start:1358 stop:1930 length:573 start_codon:yes stop_codon:yes gene_type:complete